MKTSLEEVIELLRKPGAIPIGIADYIENTLLDREAQNIILAYYDALGNSDEFEDEDNNEERLNLAITYYCKNFDSDYLFKKYVQLKDFINT